MHSARYLRSVPFSMPLVADVPILEGDQGLSRELSEPASTYEIGTDHRIRSSTQSEGK